MSQHQFTTTRNERVEAAVAAVRKGRGVLVVDDEDRENEGDIIFSAASITHEQMALLIRECSGIVCLCLPEDKVRQLDLPQMVANNTCKNRTAFTISIEAAEGVTTGVSAARPREDHPHSHRRRCRPRRLEPPATCSPCARDPAACASAAGTPKPAWISCALRGCRPTASCAN